MYVYIITIYLVCMHVYLCFLFVYDTLIPMYVCIFLIFSIFKPKIAFVHDMCVCICVCPHVINM